MAVRDGLEADVQRPSLVRRPGVLDRVDTSASFALVAGTPSFMAVSARNGTDVMFSLGSYSRAD
jgi:hypothetical protein